MIRSGYLDYLQQREDDIKLEREAKRALVAWYKRISQKP